MAFRGTRPTRAKSTRSRANRKKPTSRPKAVPSKRRVVKSKATRRPIESQRETRRLEKQRLERNRRRRERYHQRKEEAARQAEEERYIEEAIEAEKMAEEAELEQLERTARLYRRAVGWLEQMVQSAFEGTGIELSVTATAPEVAQVIPWILVGKFTTPVAMSYLEIAAIWQTWRDDLLLETAIHPQRMSQARILFTDPSAHRPEDATAVVIIGSWESVTSRVVTELVGVSIDAPSPDSLAERYQSTIVDTFYVYFAQASAEHVGRAWENWTGKDTEPDLLE